MPNANTAPAIVLDFGPPRDEPCALCGGDDLAEFDFVGVAVRDGGRVCQDCADQHYPVTGTYEVAEGLSRIDCAVTRAQPEHRAALLSIALRGMERLGRVHLDIEENPDASRP